MDWIGFGLQLEEQLALAAGEPEDVTVDALNKLLANADAQRRQSGGAATTRTLWLCAHICAGTVGDTGSAARSPAPLRFVAALCMREQREALHKWERAEVGEG